jgi:uncharacterized cupredoxin-like copper-binding protein
MKKLRSVSVLLFVLSLVLTACGGGGASTKIDVTFTDFKFAPMDFTIAAGKEITLTAKNEGAVPHEFVIMNKGQSAGDKFGDEDEGNIYWEVELDPGKTSTVTFTAPSELGEYEVVCGTPAHLEAGMKAKLTVSAP